jgi:CDP-4-dehydro-6-deoxyglucose reductase
MTFDIETQPGGIHFQAEGGETLLAAALRQGVVLPYGCRSGMCGSCLATLISGRVSYPSGNTQALEGREAGSCLVCQAVAESDLVLGVTEIKTASQIEVRTLPCRVVDKRALNHDVMMLHLKLPENQRLPFLAGQYLDFLLEGGKRRAFSIANPPHDDEFIELHVRHVPGGEFTGFIFDALEEKAILRIQAPLGTFTLREDSDRPIIFIAGGTGLAPIKGIIEHAFYVGVTRPMHLYWGARRQVDLYLPDLPLRWVKEHANFTYTPVLSEPDTTWTGRTGFVHEAVLADHPDMSSFDVYLAGPPIMVQSGSKAFAAAGLAGEHMYSDAFEYAKPNVESPNTGQ